MTSKATETKQNSAWAKTLHPDLGGEMVRRWNCHADMLTALRAFVSAEEAWLAEKASMPPGTFDDPLGDALVLARAAIAKAQP